MIEIKGKYNSCKVFTDEIDNETIGQLIELTNQKSVTDLQIRIMPDCHAGAGCVIGTTMTLQDKVIPNLVGVDIGCGILAVKLKETNINLVELDRIIHKYIPAGFAVHDTAITTSNIKNVIAPVDLEYAYRSLGTLGGGNHFIEVDKDSDNNLWLVIHTGSRHIGIEICKYYQDVAYQQLKERALGGSLKRLTEELIKQLKAENRHRDIHKEIERLKEKYRKSNTSIPKELAYVTKHQFNNYLHDMKLAQEYACNNRKIIADTILRKAELHAVDSFQTIHNYIDIDSKILRKGAVSAKKGETLIIPMNMRDGSLICIGKGELDWNESAPHGAGRIMSRAKAKERISMSDYKSSMKDIYTTSVNEFTIDESPFAYKSMQSIIDNIQDTVEIVDIIRPIYNFKASKK